MWQPRSWRNALRLAQLTPGGAPGYGCLQIEEYLVCKICITRDAKGADVTKDPPRVGLSLVGLRLATWTTDLPVESAERSHSVQDSGLNP